MSNEGRGLATAGRQQERKPHLQPGFSLVELLAVLAVLAVILASAPSMAHLVRQARVQGSFHAMSSSLALARLSAISRGHPVTLCPSMDGTGCTAGSDWSGGWIVYLDRGRKNQPRNVGDVIEVSSALRGGLTLRTSPGRHRIRYQPSGWAYGSNLTLTLCTQRPGNLAGSVVVNNAGRSRIERPGVGTPCPHSD